MTADPSSTAPVVESAAPPPPPPARSAVPTTVPVSQRFEMLGRIGAGNHGVVFRARDKQLQREVAIKRFSHFVADDPRAMRRITREVATLARVSHRNVVTVHDLVHMPDGDGEITPHLVMELVDGTSLRDLLTHQGPSPRSVVVVRGVLEGLAACHQAGILHLDIKPANVLVNPDGGIKIVDFGIARAASDATATVAGTPHYMAPEQFEGRADERSDIYSVGCLLYECLTGAPPFDGTMAVQLMAHRNNPRPDPRDRAPQVSGALAAVVQRAMAIDPDDRFHSVQQMSAALVAVGTGIDVAQPERLNAGSPAPAAGRPVAAVSEHLPVSGPVVTRWSKLQTFTLGLALSAFVVALVPGLVWTAAAFVPTDYQLPAMQGSDATGWWLLAVALATGYLLLRRRVFFSSLSGPAIGEPRAARRVDRSMRSGLRTAAGAAVRGSLLMLLPLYVMLVASLMQAGGQSWPAGVLDTGWGLAWALMPLASLVLAVRSVTRVRLRLGSLFMATLYLAGAALAAVLFIAYPYAI